MLKRTLLCICLIFSNFAYALQDNHHNTVTLASLAGKWVILNYWASWCGACADETPGLNHLSENAAKSNIVVYGVNYDQDDAPTTDAKAQKMGINFPVLYQDPHDDWGLSAVGVLPTTFIINPKGKVVEKILGSRSEEFFLAQIKALAKQ